MRKKGPLQKIADGDPDYNTRLFDDCSVELAISVAGIGGVSRNKNRACRMNCFIKFIRENQVEALANYSRDNAKTMLP